MKKMKKIMSLLLAFVLVMSLSLTVFAATPLENGTLQVTGAQLSGKNVTAVRMFTANVDDKNSDGKIDAGDVVSYEMEAAWQGFFNEQLTEKSTENATSEEAYEYVANMQGQDTELVKFAKVAKDYYNKNQGSFSKIAKEVKAEDNTATFNELATGYYLVLPANGSTSADRATDAMIVNVPSEKAASLQLKTAYPTVDKVIVDNGENKSGASTQIGDKVNFKLTSSVPNMTDYSTYFFEFQDTLSKGLTVDRGSVAVTIGGTDRTSNCSVTLASVEESGENVLKITFSDLTKVPEIKAGQEIIVTYTATLNENAVVGQDGNKNEVKLEYSNDPNTSESHGHSESDITKTYTFDINVHKYANGNESTLLSGAEFQLLTNTEDTPIQMVKENDYTFHIATATEIAASGGNVVTNFVTNGTNEIVIKGLKEGTYKLHEVNPPVGYNKLTKDVTIAITAQYEENGTLKAGFPKYSVNNEGATSSNIVKVENKTGAFLPETGSIGTIGLTVLGVILVVAGLGFTSRKKKEQE